MRHMSMVLTSLLLLLLGITSPPAAAGPIIVTGPESGGGPDVRVFDAATGELLMSFFAFDPGFLGGVRVGSVDANGDGIPDVIVTAGPGGGPHLRVFDGAALLTGHLVELVGIFAYDPGLRSGMFVAGGTPTPPPGGDITAVTPGLGLTGGGASGAVTLGVDTGAIQARVSGACPAGQSIRAISAAGGVTCQADSNSGGTVTSVNTGPGLTGGPITATGILSVAPGGVSSAMLAPGAVTAAHLAAGSVDASKIVDGSIGAADVNSSQVQLRVSGSCPAGSAIGVVNGDGTVACQTDTNTTYAAGAGLSLAGTTFSVDTATIQARVTGACPAGSAVAAVNADGTASCQPLWALGGNAGTAPGTHFLGTTDNVALEAKVNGERAWRVEPATAPETGFSPNVIGGHSANGVTAGVAGATIAGGGAPSGVAGPARIA